MTYFCNKVVYPSLHCPSRANEIPEFTHFVNSVKYKLRSFLDRHIKKLMFFVGQLTIFKIYLLEIK